MFRSRLSVSFSRQLLFSFPAYISPLPISSFPAILSPSILFHDFRHNPQKEKQFFKLYLFTQGHYAELPLACELNELDVSKIRSETLCMQSLLICGRGVGS